MGMQFAGKTLLKVSFHYRSCQPLRGNITGVVSHLEAILQELSAT